MSNIHYKIWDWGTPTREGRNIQFNVGVSTKAKRSEENIYELANEMLCLRLAHALKLPVPSGGIIENDGHRWFASLEYSVAEETLPKPTRKDLEAFVNASAWLACGIIAFDAWICNDDRQHANIRYNRADGRVFLFDHGSAPMYGETAERGRRELEAFKDEFPFKSHCLAPFITSLNDFSEWHRRINAIPEYFVRESIRQSVELGLPADQESFCVDFLLDRRARLKTLFQDKFKAAFPRLIRQATLFDPPPFEFQRGDFDYSI